MRPSVLISACLLGVSCRYDGKSKPLPPQTLAHLAARFHLVPVCPELFGGLPTPRPSAERQGAHVRTADGADVTQAYLSGARQVLELARLLDCHLAILKENSPSCGAGTIYDGTFSRTLTQGDGVTAALLRENGIRVVGETALDALPEGRDHGPDGGI